METKVVKIESDQQTKQIQAAAEMIRSGGLVGLPTETVYGLGANALDGQAVRAIFDAKGRPQDNPLIVHISAPEEWERLVAFIPEEAKKLARAFWPGPLTIILPKSDLIPDEVSAGLETVAVRMPSHPVMRAIIRCSGVPIAAPSANLSGSPSPTNAKAVYEDMNGKIPMIVDGGTCAFGVESTVVSLACDPPRVLRPGGITVKQLEDVLGDVVVDPAVLSGIDENRKVSSPGMKYKHYAPKTKVVILKGSSEKFRRYLEEHQTHAVALCFEEECEDLPVRYVTYGQADNALSQAQHLFESLRKLDELGEEVAYAHCPGDDGIGLAVYNRLLRSAAFDEIEL